MAHQDALEGEGEEDSGICKAQDLHTMLDTILGSGDPVGEAMAVNHVAVMENNASQNGD